ncbi:phosphopantothenoylcysteine decarboxylase [Melissococcus plutonius]|uniref:Phosphopantothenoylcysteine decarboxylase n=2 Tax=Melissococcus plutonius TaxID=33970 RepID=F3YC00_MELPT|nr:phosphopantothenoylcysteine decarboxylase [Melissococcus plutonius]BAL61723.1 phosphopantothenoylcysteine decarboxylase [Melissococcus plutonius DAT561]AIM25292.1 phosphopantothenoylcysteine decarboxylase [Melissococcus plutonius S1]KMT23977.1 phosphopantothenoylcysteine decarboxylase [Melissococcus plutonius]KMT24500.1 phosphopantothenoylcysteine decarboxylase [Melissococcus plutonius]KMT26073.1 phosphopantothenoylcysteine decarboxylase [Melissococcus plutonius]
MKTILLGVTGSIAAYKAADIVSQLKKLNYTVEVIMTKNSTAFITPLTLQSLSKNPVHVDVMEERTPAEINHIELARRTDLFLIAPATANTIGKLANGIADDMLTTVALALKPEIPRWIAPAMNTYMYENSITQRNLGILKEAGYHEIKPKEALLACGDVGRGALAEVYEISQIIHKTLN